MRDVAEFVDAVERVAAGGTAFDPAVVSSLVGGRRGALLDELTDREREVLGLIAEGRSNRAIAAQLSSARAPSSATCRRSSRSSACPRARTTTAACWPCSPYSGTDGRRCSLVRDIRPPLIRW